MRRIGFVHFDDLESEDFSVPQTRLLGWLAGLSDILAMFMSSYQEPIAREGLIEALRSGQDHHRQLAGQHEDGSEQRVFHTAYAFAYGHMAATIDPNAEPETGP